MSLVRVFLLPITFLLIVEFIKCNYINNEPLRETYVSPVEKTIERLIKFGQILNGGITNIKEEFTDIVFESPSLRQKSGENNATTIARIFNPFKSKIKAIFPGTYWCGDGDVSPNKEDLGLFENTDACCKAHDACPDSIPAQGTRDGLLNTGIFTRSSCECDAEFYHCLKKVDTVVAFQIGTTYFNILKPQCFKKHYPVDNCINYQWRRLINNECGDYQRKDLLPGTFQWFNNLKYK